METKKSIKYEPSVKIRELLEFRADIPETYTASPFVNAFLKIFYATEADEQDIAEMMELPYRAFSGAFSVETGITLRQFHNYWRAYRLNKVLEEKPWIDGDELAQKLGYGHRSALWQFYNSKVYKRIAKELGFRLFPTPRRQVHH